MTTDSTPQKAIFSALRRDGVRAPSALEPGEIARAASADPEGFARVLRAFTRFVTPGVGTSSHDATGTRILLDAIAAGLEEPSHHLDYLRASTDLFIALDRVGTSSAVKARDTSTLIDAARNATAGDPARYNSPGGQIAAAVTRGKIHSLEDRDAANDEFARARDMDTARIIRHFYVDMGAMTYYSDPAISEADTTADITGIQESLRPYGEVAARASTSLVISVDARFYRVYAPLLHFYAQQLPDIDVSIVICGNRGVAKELITDSRRYMNALRALNHSGKATNIHHYVIPVPQFVAEPKTFYACARFFVAPQLLNRYENLYLMDADLTVDTHPAAFLNSVSKLPFAAPRTGGEAALSPWRRYMAGNIPLNRSVLDTTILEDIQRYLAVGLRSRASWMLDQNSLAYAIERSPASFTNLNEYSRPFRAPSFKVTWEKNFQG